MYKMQLYCILFSSRSWWCLFGFHTSTPAGGRWHGYCLGFGGWDGEKIWRMFFCHVIHALPYYYLLLFAQYTDSELSLSPLLHLLRRWLLGVEAESSRHRRFFQRRTRAGKWRNLCRVLHLLLPGIISPPFLVSEKNSRVLRKNTELGCSKAGR